VYVIQENSQVSGVVPLALDRHKVYTNVDPVLRQAIAQLPVAEWL